MIQCYKNMENMKTKTPKQKQPTITNFRECPCCKYLVEITDLKQKRFAEYDLAKERGKQEAQKQELEFLESQGKLLTGLIYDDTGQTKEAFLNFRKRIAILKGELK